MLADTASILRKWIWPRKDGALLTPGCETGGRSGGSVAAR